MGTLSLRCLKDSAEVPESEEEEMWVDEKLKSLFTLLSASIQDNIITLKVITAVLRPGVMYRTIDCSYRYI